LLRNLGDAVKTLGDRHHVAAHRTAQHVRAYLVQRHATVPPSPAASVHISNAVHQASAVSFTFRQARYEEAARLCGVGSTTTRILSELGADSQNYLCLVSTRPSASVEAARR
jgi:hypothetical protein